MKLRKRAGPAFGMDKMETRFDSPQTGSISADDPVRQSNRSDGSTVKSLMENELTNPQRNPPDPCVDTVAATPRTHPVSCSFCNYETSRLNGTCRIGSSMPWYAGWKSQTYLEGTYVGYLSSHAGFAAASNPYGTRYSDEHVPAPPVDLDAM